MQPSAATYSHACERASKNENHMPYSPTLWALAYVRRPPLLFGLFSALRIFCEGQVSPLVMLCGVCSIRWVTYVSAALTSHQGCANKCTTTRHYHSARLTQVVPFALEYCTCAA